MSKRQKRQELLEPDRQRAAPARTMPAAGPDGVVDRARLLWLLGDWDELVSMAADYHEHHENRAQLALLVAAAFCQLGDADRARDWIGKARQEGCERAVIEQVLISGVHNSLGRAYQRLGQSERAEHHLKTALSVGYSGRPVPRIDELRIDEQGRQLSRDRARHRARLAAREGEAFFVAKRWKEASGSFGRAIAVDPDCALYHQWLGETEARLGQWNPASKGYREALKRDPNVGIAFYRDLPVATIEPGPNDVESPVFIVGCGHSGTSIMLAMMGSHPALHPIPQESGLFLKDDETVLATMSEWDAQCASQGRRRWIEKTPPHIFQIGRFLKMRPKARFIVMLRDGRDVVCSLKHRPGYKNFEDRLDRWIYDNMAGLPYWEHPQVTFVRYEDLIEEPETTLKKICGFLGEDYDSRMLSYHKEDHRWYSDKVSKPDQIINHADHMNLRNWQINQPLFDGRGRWKAETSREELRIFGESPAAGLMVKFEYWK